MLPAMPYASVADTCGLAEPEGLGKAEVGGEVEVAGGLDIVVEDGLGGAGVLEIV